MGRPSKLTAEVIKTISDALYLGVSATLALLRSVSIFGWQKQRDWSRAAQKRPKRTNFFLIS
jgi:hypothetical protein